MKKEQLKEKKPGILKLKEVARFMCAKPENVQNITMALVQAGRFVNVIRIDGDYCVFIYERA